MEEKIKINPALQKTPVAEQPPLVRNRNFEEVCLGYTEEEAKAEAAR